MVENLHAITGSMFSGKTDEVIRQANREMYAGKKLQAFYPAIDNRREKGVIQSHSGAKLDAEEVSAALDILKMVEKDTKVVVIDEVQFFDSNIVGVSETLLENDIKVILGGLPTDFRGMPFGSMPELLARSDKISRLTAICTHETDGIPCGKEATRTQRFVDGEPAKYTDPVVVIGAEEQYSPRCRDHHKVPGKPKSI